MDSQPINMLCWTNAYTIWFRLPPKTSSPRTTIYSNKTLHSLAMQIHSNNRYGWPLWHPPLARPPISHLAISLRAACTDFSVLNFLLISLHLAQSPPDKQTNHIPKHLANHVNKLYWRPSGSPKAPTHHQFPHPTRIQLTSQVCSIACIGRENSSLPIQAWSDLNASLSGYGCPKGTSQWPSAVALPL